MPLQVFFCPFRKLIKRIQTPLLVYFEAYLHDVVEHYSSFLANNEEQDNIMKKLTGSKEQELNRYTVNLVVNNKNLKGAPVIYETN